MARKFFYVSAGILMLAISYNLGARTASAQSGGGTIASIASFGSSNQGLTVVTTGGDVYVDEGTSGYGHYHYAGNVFNQPTVVAPTTLGRVKATYR